MRQLGTLLPQTAFRFLAPSSCRTSFAVVLDFADNSTNLIGRSITFIKASEALAAMLEVLISPVLI